MNWRAVHWKHCPFCGSEALRAEEVLALRWAVVCDQCGTIGPTQHWPLDDPPDEREWSLNRTADEAVVAWNARF